MIVTDVVVCGAGVIGCAVARALALAGLKVHVLERSRPGDEASGAAAGMLTAQAFADSASPFVELGRRSLAMYEPLARELAEETGIEIEFRRTGSLRVPSGGADELELSSLFFFQKKTAGPSSSRLPTGSPRSRRDNSQSRSRTVFFSGKRESSTTSASSVRSGFPPNATA